MEHENSNNNALDHELNVALAKFTAVEPRTGLEDRVLANLRVQQAHGTGQSWWRWPVMAALAAAILVSLSIALRSERGMRSSTAHSPATTQNAGTRTANNVANNKGSRPILPHEAGFRKRIKPVGHPAAVVALAPKLNQFPSPQPMSEQEIMLARYVANYPEHAALIARARTEELRRDSIEETLRSDENNSQ
jgi:hypothetical protein